MLRETSADLKITAISGERISANVRKCISTICITCSQRGHYNFLLKEVKE